MNQAVQHHTTSTLPATLGGETSTFFFDGKPYDIVVRDGEPWFLAPQLAAVLGHRAASDMTRLLKDKHRGTHSVRTPGGYQSVTIVSEPGFYQAVLSRKPTAKAMPGMAERIERFQDWVVEEVLPTIRKTGSYVIPGAAPAAPFDPMAMLQDVDVLIPLLATMAQRVKVAEAAVEAARPAVDFVGALADSDGLWGLRAAGKALHQGPDRFIKWLRERGDLYDLDDGPVPKQHLIDRGVFTVVWREFGGKQRPTTKITGKGIVHYAKALGVRPPGAPVQALLPGL